MTSSLVGSEMCIRDSPLKDPESSRSKRRQQRVQRTAEGLPQTGRPQEPLSRGRKRRFNRETPDRKLGPPFVDPTDPTPS
eukprot:12160932-Prorocentrum_lima.AAC.1